MLRGFRRRTDLRPIPASTPCGLNGLAVPCATGAPGLRATSCLSRSDTSAIGKIEADENLSELFALMHHATGVDFSLYRQSTVQRRIQRRQALLNLNTLKAYVEHLKQNPVEIPALYQDLLFKVTQFFRDPEAFDALSKWVFPQLLKNRSAKDPIRLWVSGCASGEGTQAINALTASAFFVASAGRKARCLGTREPQEDFTDNVDVPPVASSKRALPEGDTCCDILPAERWAIRMRTSPLKTLLLLVPMASVLAQTPALQMNVVYVCTDGQSFKVFSCNDTTGACDYQNYKNGQAFQRGEALKEQLTALLPAKCHAQTPAEAQIDPHRGEIPPAPSPFAGRAAAPRGASTSPSQTPAAVDAQNATSGGIGGGGFKVGDSVRVLTSGWQDAKVLQVRGNSYFVRLDNGIEISKGWPIEVRRQGKLTAADHAAGQWDLHEKVQVLVNGRWMEGEIVGQSYNRYTVQLPGEKTVAD